MSRPFLASGISNGSFQDGPVVTVILISVGISHFLPVILPAPSRSQFSPLLVLSIGEARQVHVIHLQLPEVSSAAYNADQKERKKKTTLRKSRTVLDCCFQNSSLKMRSRMLFDSTGSALFRKPAAAWSSCMKCSVFGFHSRGISPLHDVDQYF